MPIGVDKRQYACRTQYGEHVAVIANGLVSTRLASYAPKSDVGYSYWVPTSYSVGTRSEV